MLLPPPARYFPPRNHPPVLSAPSPATGGAFAWASPPRPTLLDPPAPPVHRSPGHPSKPRPLPTPSTSPIPAPCTVNLVHVLHRRCRGKTCLRPGSGSPSTKTPRPATAFPSPAWHYACNQIDRRKKLFQATEGLQMWKKDSKTLAVQVKNEKRATQKREENTYPQEKRNKYDTWNNPSRCGTAAAVHRFSTA